MKGQHKGARRGRPRGRQAAIDRGTEELQAKRAALAGDGDPALAEYPLGVLLARRIIDTGQHEAGCYYAFLYGQAIGRTQATCDPLYRRLAAELAPGGSPMSEAARAHVERQFRLGKGALYH